MQALIREFLDRPDVRAYFRPGVRLRNEAEIIAPGGDVFRPDRIVEVANGLSVIDFKTGAPSESHRGQVRHYVDLLKGMTSKPVHGVVLYLDHHEPIHVD